MINIYQYGFLQVQELYLNLLYNHPFYSNGEWVEAGKLSIGDKILHVDGLEHTIETIELSDESATVYNFEVEGTHNYFAEGYLVHNVQKNGDL